MALFHDLRLLFIASSKYQQMNENTASEEIHLKNENEQNREEQARASGQRKSKRGGSGEFAGVVSVHQ